MMNRNKKISISYLLSRLPDAFIPEAAADVSATIQLNLSGEQGGSWYIQILNQQCSIHDGICDTPNLIFSADGQDCLDVFSGKLDAMGAYMQGKLRLNGNMMLAMRLTNLFKASRFAKAIESDYPE